MTTSPIRIIKACITTTPVRIVKVSKTIRIISPRPTAMRVEQFSFTATAGQTTYTLPFAPASDGLFIFVINGTTQDQAGGDFTISGSVLTFEALDLGDKGFGIYEKQ